MHFAGICIVQDRGNPVKMMLVHHQDGFALELSNANMAQRVRQVPAIWHRRSFDRISIRSAGPSPSYLGTCLTQYVSNSSTRPRLTQEINGISIEATETAWARDFHYMHRRFRTCPPGQRELILRLKNWGIQRENEAWPRQKCAQLTKINTRIFDLQRVLKRDARSDKFIKNNGM